MFCSSTYNDDKINLTLKLLYIYFFGFKCLISKSHQICGMDLEPTINISSVKTFKIWSFGLGKKKGQVKPCSRKTHFEILPFIQ